MNAGSQCGRCGAPVVGGAIFCSKCGVDVTMVQDGQDTLAMTTAGTPVEPVRSTMRQLLRDATLGEYEILNELGRGGMATVFLAHDIALDRKVAIKVMASHLLEGEGMAERFKLEARTAAKLSHPHIIPIYAVKESASTLFFVMKFIEGKALDDIIKKMGPMPIPMVKDILTKVGGALGYAHRRDVVHRDVKPGNIMVDEEGTPIVTDFGIAKVATQTGLTQTGTTIGTPSYMSPEQCQAKEVTGASDQYALGIVAFEMLTGKLPFEGDSAVTTMFKHVNEQLPPLADFRPDCPPEVLETVTRMVAKDPSDRWPSLEAAMQRLGADATQTYVDPIQSQLVQAAKDGDLALVAQLSTGSQAIGAQSGPRSSQAGNAARKRVPAMIAAGVVLIAATVTLAVVQPWAADDPGTLAEGGGGEVGGGPDAGGDQATGDGAPSGAGSEGEPPPEGVESSSAGGSAGPADRPGADSVGAPTENAGDLPPPEPAAFTPRRVQTVVFADGSEPMEPGDAAVLAVTVRDRSGARIPESVIQACGDHGWSRCGYEWSSGDESVARVGSDGRVTAVAPGETDIAVTVGGVSGTKRVIVSAASASRVDIEPRELVLAVGDAASLSARIFGRGDALLTDRTVIWASDDPSVASIDGDGRVTAARSGRTTLSATSGSVRSTVEVAVEAAPVDTRTALEELIANYARALESRDIEQVRRAYPGLTSDQEEALGGALGSMEGLRAVLTVESTDDQGDMATAQVRGTYSFTSDGRALEAPISFTAVFERGANGWRMTETRDSSG